MKLKHFSLIALLLLGAVFTGNTVLAQRFQANVRVSSFNLDRVNNNSSYNFNGSSDLGVDLRYFTRSKFGFRAGVGIENLNYQVKDGVSTDFEARRQDLQGIFGVEWHPFLGKCIDIYPGLYIPVTVTGDDIVQDNLNTFRGGNFSAGLGTNLGINIRMLRVLRVGVEFDARYQNFESAAVESFQNTSLEPLGRMNYSTSFILGILL